MDAESVATLVAKACDVTARSWGLKGEEILGEVFGRIYSRLQKGQIRDPIRYVEKTAYREARSCCRREKARRLSFLTSPIIRDDRPAPFERSPLEQLAAAEEHNSLRAAVERLSPDLRTALHVRARCQGAGWVGEHLPLDVTELAKLRGCTRQSVYAMADRAARIVRRAMTPGEQFDA